MTITTVTKTITAAEPELFFPLTGSMVNCIKCNQDSFELRLGTDGKNYFAEGISQRLPEGGRFESVTFINKHATDDLVVTLIYGDGEFNDSRLISSSSTKITVDNLAATEFEAIEDQTVLTGVPKQILIEDKNTTDVTINNLSETDFIRVGNSTVTASKGTLIAAGGNFVLTYGGDLYAFQESGNPVVIAVNRLKREAV
jgi:hypothetical protein